MLRERLAETVTDPSTQQEFRHLLDEDPNLDFFEARDRVLRWKGAGKSTARRAPSEASVQEVASERSEKDDLTRAVLEMSKQVAVLMPWELMIFWCCADPPGFPSQRPGSLRHYRMTQWPLYVDKCLVSVATKVPGVCTCLYSICVLRLHTPCPVVQSIKYPVFTPNYNLVTRLFCDWLFCDSWLVTTKFSGITLGLKPASNDSAYSSQLCINWMTSGLPHLLQANSQWTILSDLCKMCNLEGNLLEIWIGDHRFLTYIFKWGGLPFPHRLRQPLTPLYNDKLTTGCSTKRT